jgi:short-subunit dehydrogenase
VSAQARGQHEGAPRRREIRGVNHGDGIYVETMATAGTETDFSQKEARQFDEPTDKATRKLHATAECEEG